MVHLTFICVLFIKTETLQEHDLYYNQILHHFDPDFFPTMNNKKVAKNRALHNFCYEMSIVL